MRKFLIILHGIFILSINHNLNAQLVTEHTVSRPKLVVGLIVDQMRWDYLYRYYHRFGPGGFKRMLNEGFSCENTFINYLPAKTAIGHSSVYTGSVPAIHGITGNDFIHQPSGAYMYCTGDSTVETVGAPGKAGKMSPRNLITTTITDELKLATNFKSKVIGISIKDRGAILPAGHVADAAYWLDESSGKWITSTFYMKSLPDWVENLNAENQPAKFLQQKWTTLYSIHTYVQSTQDNTPYEKPFKGQTTPVFPVNLPALAASNGVKIISSTPFGNTLTLNMAKAAVANERLGKNTVTDFLAVSLSSTDYVGHQFGINSIELEDTYLRLDKDLADFFQYLDREVGKGMYTVFLTADHGCAHNPAFMINHQLPGGIFNASETLTKANTLLEKEFGYPQLILSLANNEVHLNNTLIKMNKLDEKRIRQWCVAFFNQFEAIAWAIDMIDINANNVPDYLLTRLKNGYNRERSGGIFLVFKSGFLPANNKTGTDHGNWHSYDTNIPLVWMGWGIKKGKTKRTTYITDIAPTVSALLHIPNPSGSIGDVITEVLQ